MMRIGTLLRRLPEPVKSAIKDRVWPPLLPEGETAPEWHLQGHDGSWHRLGPYWAVMAFIPTCKDDPVVGRMLDELQAHSGALKQVKARVFPIMTLEAEFLAPIAERHGLSFPLITDRGGSVSRQFRAAIQLPMRTYVIPTVYLVNPQRKIRLANRGVPSMEAVVRSIQALSETTRDGM